MTENEILRKALKAIQNCNCGRAVYDDVEVWELQDIAAKALREADELHLENCQ